MKRKGDVPGRKCCCDGIKPHWEHEQGYQSGGQCDHAIQENADEHFKARNWILTGQFDYGGIQDDIAECTEEQGTNQVGWHGRYYQRLFTGLNGFDDLCAWGVVAQSRSSQVRGWWRRQEAKLRRSHGQAIVFHRNRRRIFYAWLGGSVMYAVICRGGICKGFTGKRDRSDAGFITDVWPDFGNVHDERCAWFHFFGEICRR